MPTIKATVEIRKVAGTEVSATLDADKPLMIMTRMASRGMGLWDTVWDQLAEQFSLVSFDLRMPTSNELDDPAAVFRAYATQCKAISSELGYGGYHVFGWNGGSHVALQCAADDPDNVQSCLLVGAFYRLPDMRRVEAGVEFMRVVFQNPDRKVYALYWLMAGLSQRFVENNFDQVDAWAEARVGGDRFVNQDDERVTKWVRALRNHWVSEDQLQSITTPMLIVAPEIDHWHAGPTVEMAAALHSNIPPSRLEVMKGVGSMVMLEDPDRFLGTIKPFFNDVMGSG